MSLFDAVQAKLSKQVNHHKTARMRSEALLAGRIFDDRGNRMTPSHVRKRGIKYRYYLSSALLQGQPERAGGVSRIPAAEIEGLVVRSVRDHLNQSEEIEDAVLISAHVARIEVQSDQLVIELTNAKGSNKPKLHRVAADGEHDWDAGGRSLSRESRKHPGCDDHSDLKLDQISDQRWQSIRLVSRPAIFDHQVAAFNIAGLVQTLPESG
jgi:hypothetical protein